MCQIYITSLPTLEFKRFSQAHIYKLLFIVLGALPQTPRAFLKKAQEKHCRSYVIFALVFRRVVAIARMFSVEFCSRANFLGFKNLLTYPIPLLPLL